MAPLWDCLASVAMALKDAAWVPAGVQDACRRGKGVVTILESLLQGCFAPAPGSLLSCPPDVWPAIEKAQGEAGNQLRAAARRVADAVNAYGDSAGSSHSSRGNGDSVGSVSSRESYCSESGMPWDGTPCCSYLGQLAQVAVRHLPSAVAATRQLTAGLAPGTTVASTATSLVSDVTALMQSMLAGGAAAAAGQPPPAAQQASLSAGMSALSTMSAAHANDHLLESLLELAQSAPEIGYRRARGYAAAALAALQLLPLVPRLGREEGAAEDVCDYATELAKHLLRRVQDCLEVHSDQAASPAMSALLWHAHQWAARLVHASGDAAQRSMLPALNDSHDLMGLLLVSFETA